MAHEYLVFFLLALFVFKPQCGELALCPPKFGPSPKMSSTLDHSLALALALNFNLFAWLGRPKIQVANPKDIVGESPV